MEKIIAMLLVLVMLLALSATALADDAPLSWPPSSIIPSILKMLP